MADDKRARDAQADNEERRQRERELEEARERADEPEPEDADPDLRLDDALEHHEYPTTTEELTAAYGDYEVETREGRTSIENAFAGIDGESYDSAEDVRDRVRGLIRR